MNLARHTRGAAPLDLGIYGAMQHNMRAHSAWIMIFDIIGHNNCWPWAGSCPRSVSSFALETVQSLRSHLS
jgi:hypothetical protein